MLSELHERGKMCAVMLRCTCCGEFTVEQIWLQRPVWRRPRRVLRVLRGSTLLGRGYYETVEEVVTLLAWRGVLHRMEEVDGSQADIPRRVDCPK